MKKETINETKKVLNGIGALTAAISAIAFAALKLIQTFYPDQPQGTQQ